MTLTEVSIHGPIRPIIVCPRGEDGTTVSLCNTGNYKLYCNYKKKNTFIFDSNMKLTIWKNVYRFLSGSINENKMQIFLSGSNTMQTVPRNNQKLHQRKKVSWEIIFVPIFIYFENHSTSFQWIRLQGITIK